jgi:hypothetical protein
MSKAKRFHSGDCGYGFVHLGLGSAQHGSDAALAFAGVDERLIVLQTGYVLWN